MRAQTTPYLPALLAIALSACGSLPPQEPSSGHLRADTQPAAKRDIPPPLAATPLLPRPRPAAKTETYSVSVRNIPVQELLFALARDAKLNIDIHPGINGAVTINAIDQTLQQILSRIAKQIDMRWELDGPNLVVMPDSPFLRTYKVDYVNMTRDVSVTTSVNSQVTSNTGGTTGGASAGGGGSSITKIENTAKNRFWETLEKNIKDILHETDKILPEGSSETLIERADQSSTSGEGGTAAPAAGNNRNAAPPAGPGSSQQSGSTVIRRTTFREAASVIANPETGVIAIRATGRQHEKIQEFLDRVMSSARRQVLIEATIAEVNLSQNYQQGIDWQRLRSDGTGIALTQSGTNVLATTGTGGTQLRNATQLPTGGSTASGAASSLFVLSYRSSPTAAINFAAAVKLLESFGNVKILSSPKLSVLNNQTALLKVVNNLVYFTVKADTTTQNGVANTTVTTTPQSVSVGLIMSVTPQISEDNSIVLNVRPVISSTVGEGKLDPNPSIPAGIPNRIPEIQTREMESVLRVGDGDIAILGGLMQDTVNYRDDGVPGLSRLPGIGSLFGYKNESSSKTELVIFLRPIVIRDASLDGDFAKAGVALPERDFLRRSWRPQPLGEEAGQ